MKNYTQFILYKENLLHNLDMIRSYTSKKICIMVKADGYGYGMINIAKILDKKVDFFGVANGEEALKLRANNIKTKILVCGIAKDNLIPHLIKNKISIACNSLTFMKRIEKVATKLKLKVLLHLVVNSGMNRLGVKNEKRLKEMVDYAKDSKYLILEGVFTHTGFSELQNKDKMKIQFKHFIKMVKYADFPIDTCIHFSNSGAFSYGKDYHCDMVRIGKIIYGVNPNYVRKKFNLNPIFALKTKVIQTQEVKKGENIGYGENLVALSDTKVGILPIGYGDGFISYYVGNEVMIKGKKYKILSICMDLTIIEIDDNVKEKDSVLVIGKDGKDIIPVTEYSTKSHNVPSQVVANFNKNRFDIVVI